VPLIAHLWRSSARVALLTLFSVAAVPSSAAAGQRHVRAELRGARLVTVHGHALPGRWQAWADASRMPTPRAHIVVRRAGCPAAPKYYAGCVYTRHPKTIWIRPGIADPRGVLLHELGHVYDLLVMGPHDRRAFRRIFHDRRTRSWWQSHPPLAEWFAEGYSYCARYARIVSVARYASYDYDPTPREHRELCRLIVRAAVDQHPSAPPPRPPVVTHPDPPPKPPPSEQPGTVPGDPRHDPGPTAPEDPLAPLLPGVPPAPPLLIPG
jgi:hypothetical protein